MGWFRKINKNGEDYKPIGNVITATSLSVSGPDLADGDVVRVMFTTDIAGSDTSTPLALTWNGGATPIPVKASKEGSLASVYAHEVATNIFKYISGYVTLEMMFDGTNLVIIGNPVVLSGSNYTIYADGYYEYRGNEVKTENISGGTYSNVIKQFYLPTDGKLYAVKWYLYGAREGWVSVDVERAYTYYVYSANGNDYPSGTEIVQAGQRITLIAANTPIAIANGFIKYWRIK